MKSFRYFGLCSFLALAAQASAASLSCPVIAPVNSGEYLLVQTYQSSGDMQSVRSVDYVHRASNETGGVNESKESLYLIGVDGNIGGYKAMGCSESTNHFDQGGTGIVALSSNCTTRSPNGRVVLHSFMSTKEEGSFNFSFLPNDFAIDPAERKIQVSSCHQI